MEKPNVTLIVGGSGEGKTEAAIKLMRLNPKPALLTMPNVDEKVKKTARELGKKMFLLPFLKFPMKFRMQLQILLDDLNGVNTAKEVAKLRSLLCYSSRHSAAEIIVCAHSLTKTNLQPFLAFCTRVIFTGGNGNKKNMEIFFRLQGMPDVESHWQKFMRMGKFTYMSVEDKKVSYYDHDLKLMQKQENQLKRERCLDMLTSLERQAGIVIFDFIFNNISMKMLNKDDLSFTLVREKNKYRVSLVDYLSILQSEEEVPSAAVIALHRYFATKFCFPQAFITNKTMKALNR